MRLVLFVLTLGSGPVVALLADRSSFAAAAGPVHSTISLFLPCLVIRLDRDRRPGAILGLVVAAGVVGDLAAAAASAGWDAAVALGGLTTQALAAVVGLAFGRCIQRPWRAALAVTIAPIGVWAVLGLLNAPMLQAWLTPYGVVTGLLAGDPGAWVRAAVLGAAFGLVVDRAPPRHP